jgi:hypothetical protein
LHPPNTLARSILSPTSNNDSPHQPEQASNQRRSPLQNRLDAANHRNRQLRGQIAELTERLADAYGQIALRNAQPATDTR